MQTLDQTTVTGRLADLPGWEQREQSIVKTYKLRNFAQAMSFVNRVAAIAETANHHPDIDIRWNKVTLVLSTHSAGGLTDNDFQVAGQIEDVSRES